MNGCKYIRTKILNLTLEELGSMLGVSRQAVHMWETTKKKIPHKRVIQLSELSGCPREFIAKNNISELDLSELDFSKIKANKSVIINVNRIVNGKILNPYYLTCQYTHECAIVFARDENQAFEKLKSKRKIETMNMSMWKIEELTPNIYDGVLYFY